MLLNDSVARNECISKNPEKLNLQFPFLTTSTAARPKLQESAETANIFLPSSNEPPSQPKKRLPLNMVISAMAEREKGLFSETEETSSTLSKIKNLKQNANDSLQKLTLPRRCKKHRVGMLSYSNNNLEQTHTSSNIHSAVNISKPDRYGHVEQDVYHHSNFNSFSESHHTPYSTPYAKSRFQQLYGNGVRTDFHFLAADAIAKDKSYSRSINDQQHPLAISDMSDPNSNTYYCAPQEHKEISVVKPDLNTKRYQPFITSQDLLEYADVPEEVHSTSMHPHAQTNDGQTDSTFNSSSADDCEPTTCFRVTYTKKNITYLNKHVQNNINITESHYEFIFEPKIIIEETGEQLSIPDLACR